MSWYVCLSISHQFCVFFNEKAVSSSCVLPLRGTNNQHISNPKESALNDTYGSSKVHAKPSERRRLQADTGTIHYSCLLLRWFRKDYWELWQPPNREDERSWLRQTPDQIEKNKWHREVYTGLGLELIFFLQNILFFVVLYRGLTASRSKQEPIQHRRKLSCARGAVYASLILFYHQTKLLSYRFRQ